MSLLFFPFFTVYDTCIINTNHQKIIPNYFKLQQSQTESDQDAARKELISALRTYAKRIKGPYFAGEQWTAVDGALAPFVERLYILEKHRNFDEKEVGDGWWEYRERLMGEFLLFLFSVNCKGGMDRSWREIARDSLKNTSSEEQYYEEILGRSVIHATDYCDHSTTGSNYYCRYLRNEAQSEVAKATRAGQSLP